jgi:hypothetical protein
MQAHARAACNVQHATDDSQRSTCNVTRCDVERAIDNAHHATPGHWAGNRKQGTDNGERGTDTVQRSALPQATQATTCKTALDDVQHGTIYTPDDMQHATGKMHLTTRSVQQTTTTQHAACSGKYAANNKRHATRMHRATGNKRQTSSNMQRTTTTCNATCSMQHATGNVQHARDNVEFGKDH